jgi:hypothetical protein
MTGKHEHDWIVEELPDPMSAGAVTRTGDLVCTICLETMPDRPGAVLGDVR